MDNEIFEKAMDMIRSRRQSAVQQNEQRISEINEKIPQIREINSVLFSTSSELVKLISSGSGTDITQKIEELKQYNLGAQSMSRKILTDNSYPADYLDLHYTCPKCQDTGYCGGGYCDCLKQLCGKLFADELNRNAQLKLCSFDTFELTYYTGEAYQTMSRVLEYAKKYAESFTPASKSIYITGRTGLGKTHISLAIANEVLQKGYSVIYDSAINILRNIEKEHFSSEHSTEYIDSIISADLLIIDDLGTEFETKFYNSAIYNIFNSRLNSGKPTIISTNLDLGGIKQRYDERIVSRIAAVYNCLEFKGEDVRLLKRKQGKE